MSLAQEGAAVVIVGRDSACLSAAVAKVDSVNRTCGFSRTAFASQNDAALAF